jgi:hypothetical protein
LKILFDNIFGLFFIKKNEKYQKLAKVIKIVKKKTRKKQIFFKIA